MTMLALSMLAALAVLVAYLTSRRSRPTAIPGRAAYLRSLQGYDIGALLAFHRAHFGSGRMEIVFDAPVTPDDVTMFVRAVPQSDTFILNRWLPDRYLDDNEVDFEELLQTNRTARFRTWDGRLHVSERDTGTRKKVKLPPLSTSVSTGEYERLQIEFARTGGTSEGALARAIYNDAQRLTNEVLNRMELARGDALSDFVMSLGLAGEPGTGLTADFGAPAGHLPNAGIAWSVANLATMTPLADLIAWRDVYVASGNAAPGALVMANVRASIVQRSAEVINAVHGSAAGRTRVTRAELNELLASEGLPPVQTYDANVDVDDVTTRIVTNDKVLMLPEPGESLGYTAWGVTATSLELVNSANSDMSFEEARGIVGVVDKIGPPYREFTLVDACGMPVIGNPRKLLVADVGAVI